MDEKKIFKICKDEGCCDACCLRYLGLKHPRTYENVKESVKRVSMEVIFVMVITEAGLLLVLTRNFAPLNKYEEKTSKERCISDLKEISLQLSTKNDPLFYQGTGNAPVLDDDKK